MVRSAHDVHGLCMPTTSDTCSVPFQKRTGTREKRSSSRLRRFTNRSLAYLARPILLNRSSGVVFKFSLLLSTPISFSWFGANSSRLWRIGQGGTLCCCGTH
ncbi:hypothetical protein M5K25_013413 [Dendrobium thyrsiflorum]|uniref:Uncharacterized protein n=1 Tax=Dendrobium thyrsiflorum TaxID=117978 RepID=A0ABD0UZN2_DENTH